MSDYTLLIGDALTMLRTLPSDSVHCAISSPPYYALRDYGTATWEGGDPYRGAADCDHVESRGTTRGGPRSTLDGGQDLAPHKTQYRSVCGKCGARRVDQQIGLEATPTEFIDKLVAVFREVRRVLHSTGQLFVNIGDTRSDSREWLGIPHRLVFALQADGWRWEDEVIWAKPNPMPGSQTNRFTRAHEYVFMLNKSRDAFFDSEAVKEPTTHPEYIGKPNGHWGNPDKGARASAMGLIASGNEGNNAQAFGYSSRIKRTVWNIATEPTPMAHYATMPTALVEPCVLSGTSAHGCCSKCLAPYERIVERTKYEPEEVPVGVRNVDASRGDKTRKLSGKGYNESVRTLGEYWQPTCLCGADVVPATVLDCFCGSGTVLAVALKFGRRAIGIDLDPRNAVLVAQRIEQTQPLLLQEVI